MVNSPQPTPVAAPPTTAAPPTAAAAPTPAQPTALPAAAKPTPAPTPAGATSTVVRFAGVQLPTYIPTTSGARADLPSSGPNVSDAYDAYPKDPQR